MAPAPPADDDLPRARDLFLPGPAAVVLGGFLERRGWELEEARPVQSLFRPGRSCTVRYRVRARGPRGERCLSLCALARSGPFSFADPPDDFETRFGIPEPVEQRDDILVWAYPYDPVLRGLPGAAHGPTVRAASGFPAPSGFSVTTLRYRPRRRAVLRYLILGGGRRGVLFGKVLPRDRLDRTFEAHLSLVGSGVQLSAPRRFEGLAGVAMFEPMAGRSLRDLLIEGERLPSPRRVAGIVRRLASTRWKGPPSALAPGRGLMGAAGLLAHLVPHRCAEVRAMAGTLAERAAGSARGATVHGDLYEGQVFVDERNAIGLIDLDDAGPGDPLLDGSNLLAHLAALSASTPGAGRRPLAYRALLRPELLHVLGGSEADLAWREALCMLLLATGPFRVLSPDWPRRVEARIDAAVRLLDRASLAA